MKQYEKILLIVCAIVIVTFTGCSDTSSEYRQGYAEGVKEARQEIANKTMTLYMSGTHPVPIPESFKDAETGLPVKFIAGCIVTDKDTGRLEGHNKIILEHIKKQ